MKLFQRAPDLFWILVCLALLLGIYGRSRELQEREQFYREVRELMKRQHNKICIDREARS